MTAATATALTSCVSPSAEEEIRVSFLHVQFFVEHLESFDVYQTLQQQYSQGKALDDLRDKEQQKVDAEFRSHGRDFVRQLLLGLGFRIARSKQDGGALLITSQDPQGVQFLITTASDKNDDSSHSGLLKNDHYHRFLQAHNGHMGIGVLAFAVDRLDLIRARYQHSHPRLIDHFYEYDNGLKILEVFAYYKRSMDKVIGRREPDTGTILRFVQLPTNGTEDALYEALGLVPVDNDSNSPGEAASGSLTAYSDHWVSNVYDRTEFLDTLQDTLGFTPKVDFNAGVVAAGEAQIESTVTGNNALSKNSSVQAMTTASDILKDQRQVYLPINNALSTVGHVHEFLQQLGQGVQHVASRVEDLVQFVQQANDNRKQFGEGFTFLNIPRSYYGILTAKDLEDVLRRPQPTSTEEGAVAVAILQVLERHGVYDAVDGSIDLRVCKEDVACILGEEEVEESVREVVQTSKDTVVDRICFSRYKNLYSLLGDQVSESTYLSIVRNKILVDIQGGDLLYQIFTANILQKRPEDEAPFLEFIQRVCSDFKDESGCTKPVKPGCGGFGIRNFLTLFLSIEVSKAMQAVINAQAAGSQELAAHHQRVVDCFTSQLNDSNPILTAISDAMTEEGRCQDKIRHLAEYGDRSEFLLWKKRECEAVKRKVTGNQDLMECSARYQQLMKALRSSLDDSLQGL